jgi:hypothetical protein
MRLPKPTALTNQAARGIAEARTARLQIAEVGAVEQGANVLWPGGGDDLGLAVTAVERELGDAPHAPVGRGAVAVEGAVVLFGGQRPGDLVGDVVDHLDDRVLVEFARQGDQGGELLRGQVDPVHVRRGRGAGAADCASPMK